MLGAIRAQADGYYIEIALQHLECTLVSILSQHHSMEYRLAHMEITVALMERGVIEEMEDNLLWDTYSVEFYLESEYAESEVDTDCEQDPLFQDTRNGVSTTYSAPLCRSQKSLAKNDSLGVAESGTFDNRYRVGTV